MVFMDVRFAGWVSVRHPKPLLLLIPRHSQHPFPRAKKCNGLDITLVILYEL